MLTKEEVLEKALAHADSKADTDTIAHTHRAISFQAGATWANDQNAARIAELEAMLSKSAFDLDGHIILLQAANQQIEKERKKIAELEAQKAELIAALNTVVSGYETDGMEGMDVRDMVFYKTCKAAIKAS
jgi:hypothetical protein